MKVAAAHAIADLVENATADEIVPNVFESGVAVAVAGTVSSTA
jgi:malate dehydrogenase (oxaloacetate-decarboxylating)